MKHCIVLFFCLSLFFTHSDAHARVANEYTVTARTLTYLPEKNTVLLRGNVTVMGSLFVIQAQEVDIVLLGTEEDTVTSFTSENIKEILFRKDLHFTYNNNTKGKGEGARFDVIKNLLIVSGNVIIDSEGNSIEGDEVEVDIATHNTSVKGNRKKPVEIFIKSKDFIK
ncbi:MAG: LptA/OstA family protein [Desulfovibrionaceae bacterium]